MRLHNRQLKATFFNDPDLLQWPRDKRYFYAGLVQIADDSACLEDSEFSFKLLIFPSPQDVDLTIDQLSIWKNELIAEKKLIIYTSQGKRCLYLRNFHKHQTLKNPSPPTVPLPEWVSWIPANSNPKAGKYTVNQDRVNSFLYPTDDVLTSNLDSSYYSLTNDLQKSYKVLTNVFQPEPEPEPEPELEPEKNTDDDDNAHAREEIKNRALETNQEEHKNPVLAMRVEAVEDDFKQAADAFSLSIALESNTEEPKNPVCALGSKAIAYAESNFGRLLSPSEIQGISDFCYEFSKRESHDPDAVVIEALKRCIDNDQRKMSYLKGILIDWLDHGVSDISHIAVRDQEWAAQKTVKSKGGNSNAKNIRDNRRRINDSATYDPSAWAKAGFAVST